MSRRLRLALFLAALAATGPMASPRVVDVARADISIAWLRSDELTALRSEQSIKAAISGRVTTRRGFEAHPDTALPNTLLSHSLFQRPPPLQN